MPGGPNDEFRMSNDERMPNDEVRNSRFVILSDFVISHSSFAKRIERSLKILRQRCFKLPLSLRSRVNKFELMGVQHHARRGEARQLLEPAILARAVGFISHDWETNVLKVDANLMRAPGVERRLHERGVV